MFAAGACSLVTDSQQHERGLTQAHAAHERLEQAHRSAGATLGRTVARDTFITLAGPCFVATIVRQAFVSALRSGEHTAGLVRLAALASSTSTAGPPARVQAAAPMLAAGAPERTCHSWSDRSHHHIYQYRTCRPLLCCKSSSGRHTATQGAHSRPGETRSSACPARRHASASCSTHGHAWSRRTGAHVALVVRR